jgi:hypothetical protein
MDITVTNTAELNIDDDVFGTRVAPLEAERCKGSLIILGGIAAR